MAGKIRTEDMDMSDEEKKLLVRALTDKTFRDELLRSAEGTQELAERDLDQVVGGVGPLPSLSPSRMRYLIQSIQSIEARIAAGEQVLCGDPTPIG